MRGQVDEWVRRRKDVPMNNLAAFPITKKWPAQQVDFFVPAGE
jgi:hypothetical protein